MVVSHTSDEYFCNTKGGSQHFKTWFNFGFLFSLLCFFFFVRACVVALLLSCLFLFLCFFLKCRAVLWVSPIAGREDYKEKN